MENSFIAIEKCAYCGGNKDSLLINKFLKPLKNNVIVNLEPCEKCFKELQKNNGVIVLEGDQYSKNIKDNPRFIKAKVEGIKKIYGKEVPFDTKTRCIIFEPELFNHFLEIIKKFEK